MALWKPYNFLGGTTEFDHTYMYAEKKKPKGSYSGLLAHMHASV